MGRELATADLPGTSEIAKMLRPETHRHLLGCVGIGLHLFDFLRLVLLFLATIEGTILLRGGRWLSLMHLWLLLLLLRRLLMLLLRSSHLGGIRIVRGSLGLRGSCGLFLLGGWSLLRLD